MTSFFPDLNVWLALSDRGHIHWEHARRWRKSLSSGRILLCCYTQIGLLRLLTNRAGMGAQVLTVAQAWNVLDRWLADPDVVLHPEPREIDGTFREVTASFANQHATKAIGDCYLLAFARQCDATLVTFDRNLATLARKNSCPSTVPI